MSEYHKALCRAKIVADSLMQKTFSNVHVEGPSLSAEKLNSSPTMAVCSHRSHLDYILIGIELNKLGLCNQRFAAGDNLTNLPYVGSKFKSWGAFTVYRARARNRSYLFQLCNQVIKMLDNGDNIIVFPEGGRSYSGQMMEMKYGILAANIIAQYHSPEKQYFYLPITISYEKLPELIYFEILEKGRRLLKQKDGFLQNMLGNAYYFGADIVAFAKFLTAHNVGIHYGEVFIDYKEPVAVNDIVDIKKHYSTGKQNEFFAHKASIQKVGEEVRTWLRQLYRILPMHIVAAILVKSGPCTQSEIAHKIPEIVVALEKENRNCKSFITMSEKEIVEKGIDQLRFSQAITTKANKIEIQNIKILKYFTASLE